MCAAAAPLSTKWHTTFQDILAPFVRMILLIANVLKFFEIPFSDLRKQTVNMCMFTNRQTRNQYTDRL